MRRSIQSFSVLAAAAGASLFIASDAAPQAQAPRGCPVSTANPARPWLDRSLTPECRADAFVVQLKTVDEKLAAVGGDLQAYGVYNVAGTDGPQGPANTPGVLALPNPMTLAASFDVDLAGAYGATVGREFRALGRQRMLGPSIDVARTWRGGRLPESYGEDPYLQSQMGVAFIKAVQSEGVAVMLKHFAVYGQEQGRTGDFPFGDHPAVNNIVSERVIRQIYLPPFRAAIEDGGAMNVMCSFPRINGVYACEHPHLLGILKNEWGMRGAVSPDFPDAQRSVVAAVNAGLDSGNFGMGRGAPPAVAPPPPPGPPGSGGPGGGGPPPGLGALMGGGIPGGISLKTAVDNGQVSIARLDDMIRRRLIPVFAVGAGLTPPTPQGQQADAQGLATALKTAEAGAVLLRNEKSILPLGPDVKSIAVIGTQAGPTARVMTQGSSYVPPIRLVPALDAIRARAGAEVAITYAQGSHKLGELPVIPVEVLKTADGRPGLDAAYHVGHGLDFSGTPFARKVEAGVNLPGPPQIANLPTNNNWSTVWTGTLTPRVSGAHDFTIAGSASGRLYIDGKLLAHFDHVDFGAVAHARARLRAGRPVKVRIEYTPRQAAPMPAIPMLGTTLGIQMKLGWAEPDGRLEAAVEAARKADVAVVFVGDSYGEGADRTTLSLSADQEDLITAVAKANPRTVVVLSSAGPVAMPWASKVSAILEMWYSGETYGQAASRLLFGDASPQGRLPLTFPKNETQGPANAERNSPGLKSANGAPDAAYFDEGLLVGYRWYDAKGQTPLYPFGFGLTYAPMTIGDVTVTDDARAVRVRAVVRNMGARADAEVVQVYAGLPKIAEEPPKRLVGFAKVFLQPGESKTVDILVPAKALEIWDEAAKGWKTPAGRYDIMVGRSSRGIVARQSITR